MNEHKLIIEVKELSEGGHVAFVHDFFVTGLGEPIYGTTLKQVRQGINKRLAKVIVDPPKPE